MLPDCDSERPNSWATYRTLTIPESCLTGSPMEIAMANALCCVYTHVVAVDGGTTAYLETYDGSEYRIGRCSSNGNDSTDTSIEIMEEAMSDVCGMSMGSRDCYDQAECMEDFLAIPSPTRTPTRAPITPTRTPTTTPTRNPTRAPSKIPTLTPTSTPISASSFPSISPTDSNISTMIPTTTDFFDDNSTDLFDDNFTTFSPFPSISPTNTTLTSVVQMTYSSSSGSLPVLSPAIPPLASSALIVPFLFLWHLCF